jgi:ribonucleotide monophosphatase NagD (HAD superfamily)
VGLDDSSKHFHFGTFNPKDLDPEVEAVVSDTCSALNASRSIVILFHSWQVAGFDGAVSYYKLAVASSLLRYMPECKFVATNRDLSFPDTFQLVPGGGMIIAAIEAGSGRSPDVVAGKPSLGLLDIIAGACPSFDRSRACMVGDRLDTDILFGNSGGLASTLFVQTGISTQAEVDALSPGDPHRPTHVIRSFGDLARLLHLAQAMPSAAHASSAFWLIELY